MSNIKHNIEEIIGHTPILELDGLEKKDNLGAHILVKLESVNPLGSLKDRIAVAMIDDLEKTTDIKPGDTIVEGSSGNTAIALAAICAKRGYKFLALIGEATEEREKLIALYGGEVIRMEDFDKEYTEGMMKCTDDYDAGQFHADYFKEKSKRDGIRYFTTNQASNLANKHIQYSTTGQEIIEDVGQVDVFIGGSGSGGSLTGISNALREKFPNVEIIAMESTDDDINALVGIHGITQIPSFMVSNILRTNDRCPYDRIIQVNKEDAYKMSNKVAKTDGIFLGITSGAAIYIAHELAKKPEYKGKNIVTIGYDDVLKYLSSDLVDKKYAFEE